jgi:hypothetical protein
MDGAQRRFRLGRGRTGAAAFGPGFRRQRSRHTSADGFLHGGNRPRASQRHGRRHRPFPPPCRHGGGAARLHPDGRGGAIGHLADGTARPMAAAIALCGLLQPLVYRLLIGPGGSTSAGR